MLPWDPFQYYFSIYAYVFQSGVLTTISYVLLVCLTWAVQPLLFWRKAGSDQCTRVKWKMKMHTINRRIALKTNALGVWTPVTSGYDFASEVTPYGCRMHGSRVERMSEAVWYWRWMYMFSQQPRIFRTWTLIQFPTTTVPIPFS